MPTATLHAFTLGTLTLYAWLRPDNSMVHHPFHDVDAAHRWMIGHVCLL